jgi:hypothetical protein
MTKKDIAIKLTKYLAWNGIFAYSIYAGVILKDTGWANIATFVIVAVFILGVLIFIANNNEKVLETYIEHNSRVVPLWVDGVFDVIVGAVLIYHSWLWLGTMYLFASFATRLLDSNAKEHTLKLLKS